MNIESPTTDGSQTTEQAFPGDSLPKYAFKLSLLVVVAGLIGLAPAGVFFKNPAFLITIVSIGAIASFLTFLGRAQTVSFRPGWFEWFLVVLVSVASWAFLGIAWLAVYTTIELLVKLVSLIFDGLLNHAQNIAVISSFVLSAVMAFGVGITIAENITRRFFSPEISSRAAYYYRSLRQQGKIGLYLLMSLIALASMGAILYLLGSAGSYLMYLGLQFIPYMSLIWLLRLGVKARADSEVFLAVVKLLESAGYQTVISPHSEDMIVDRLLSGVDMIAYDRKHTFLVKVKTKSSSSDPVEWTVGSSLQNRVKALAFYGPNSPANLPYLHEHDVQPLMVLCGRTPHQSLTDFSDEENVPVVALDMKVIDEVIETGNDEVVKKLASEHFAFLEQACDAVPPPAAVAGREATQWHL